MFNYIRRTSAMTVCERYSQHCFEQNDSHGQDIADRIFNDIVELPTKDVVEVVRCEKCMFWDTESKGLSDEHICKMHSCVGVHDRYTTPTDYCSYGERRCSG
jgi:hypothetical protein